MQVLRGFDYFYVLICKFYESYNDSAPKTTGWIIVAMVQFISCLNILVLCSFLLNFNLKDIISSKKQAIPVIITFFVLNYFRYKNTNFCNKIRDEWENKSKLFKEVTKLIWFILIIYLIVSTIVFGNLAKN